MPPVNRLLRRHNQEVYFPLAVRNVAQQIDELYWDAAGARTNGADNVQDDSVIRESDDLADDAVIARLPTTWEEGDDSAQYARQLQQLRALSRRRAELRQKLASLRQLQETLAPFADPQHAVQPSLATKDGALQRELEKTRSLSTRAAAKVARMPSGGVGGGLDEDMEVEERQMDWETLWARP